MPKPAMPMPGRVRVALVVLVLCWLFVVSGLIVVGLPWAGVAVGALTFPFLLGMVRGHPASRQWGLCVGIGGGMAAVGLAMVAFGDDSPVSVAMIPIPVVLTVALFWGLTGDEARKFFDLYCGHCRSFKVRAASMLSNRVKCRECGRKWKVHEPRVDADVFD